MADDMRKFLGTLTIADLKSVAASCGVDVSSCRKKNCYVNAIADAGVSEERVREALAKDRDEESEEMDAVSEDLKEISERSAEPKGISEKEDVGIEQSIDKALLLRPLFFEIDTATERAWNRMILGDFPEAMKLNMESRRQVINRLGTFHLYSTALSIRAAETILDEIKGFDGETASDLKTALAEAKKAFMNGPPKRREATLEEIEALTLKCIEAFTERSAEAERELRRMLDEHASFGARVEGANELLELAMQAKGSYDVGQYTRLMDEAEAQAVRAKEARVREIDGTFEHVRMAIEAAKDAGADTKDGERQLKDARKAFKENDFKRTCELLADIERAVDKAHLERVISDKDAEASEIAKITSSIEEAEPDLEEAAMYGMDVQEGLLFVRNTKSALQNRDVVTAAKLSRRVRKLTKSMEKELERARKQKVADGRLRDAKCGECGKESLRQQEDGTVSCEECGHSFSLSEDPAAAGVSAEGGGHPASEGTGADAKKRWKGLFKK